MIQRLLKTTALGLTLAGLAVPAFAQSAPPKDETTLSDLVVTAQRREEAAQDVAVALTVLKGDELADRGVVTVNNLQYTVPSLEIVPAFGGGQPQFRLRGVGFDDYASNNTSTVGVYVNEVAYPFPVQTQGVIFDIGRVEVLRGPQGTLYGRNTTGGAINFITNRPTKDFEIGGTLEAGSFDQVKAEGYISGPLSDTVRVRLSGITQQGGGWQTNRITGESTGDKDRSAVRGLLDWDITPKVSLTIDAHYANDKSDGAGLYLFAPLAFAPPTIPADTSPAWTGWGGSATFTGFTGISTTQKPFKDNTAKGIDFTFKADLGFADLTSITAFEKFDRREYNDWDASTRAFAGTYFNTNAKVFSQELRLASAPSESPYDWVIGAYYSKEDLDEEFASDFWESLLFDTDTLYKQHVRSTSVFGQVGYKISPTVRLVGGLRYESEKRSLDNFITQGVFAPGGAGIGFIPPSDVSKTNDEWSGKLGLEWRPNDDTLVYLTISRGIKSGGFTAYNTPDVTLLHPIKPEKLLAYEAGFKTEFAGDTVRLNGAVFYYDYKDQQVQSAIYTAFGPIGNIVNADAHIWGAEAELAWKPLPQLQIDQSLSYKTGEFDDFVDLDIAASIGAGHAVYKQRAGENEGFPAWSYLGDVSYVWDLGSYDLTAETNYAFHDKAKPVLLGPTYNVDSYWLANVNITLTPHDGPWSFGLWGRNVFDEKYDLTRNFFLPGISIAAPGDPATWGVRIGLKY
jgi:outer membrane receptor protein involved in Fe transport